MTTTGFLDFSTVSATSGGGVNLPDGVFPARVNSAELILSSGGRPQFQFKLAITEPAYAGAVRTEWISLQTADPSKMSGLMQVWARAFMSIGIPADQVPGLGQVSYDQIPGAFGSRDCYVEVKPKRKMDGSMTQSCSFLKPDPASAGLAALLGGR